MKKIRFQVFAFSLAVGVMAVILPGLAKETKATLHQYSLGRFAIPGDSTSNKTLGELREYGDTMIGTMAELDGEVIGLDGRFYKETSYGVFEIGDEDTITYSLSVAFSPDETFVYNGNITKRELDRYLAKNRPTDNIFFAVKVTGEFRDLHLKVADREKDEVSGMNRREIYAEKSHGTMIGFYEPHFMSSITPDFVEHKYHFHYISDDRKLGGHVVSLTAYNPEVKVQYIQEYHLELPDKESGEFWEENMEIEPMIMRRRLMQRQGGQASNEE